MKNCTCIQKPDRTVAIVFLLCLILATAFTAKAQPVISSLSSYHGAPGATLTISGSGFNTTPGNNIVYFGATRATVNTATTTSLNVTIPLGATYAPVTVTDTTTRLTGFCGRSFLPTQNPALTQVWPEFTTPIADLGWSYGHTHFFLQDLDMDGKTDVCSVHPDRLAIYHNTSSSTATLLSTPTEIFYGYPVVIRFGDLDGDGRKDMVTFNYSGFSSIENLRIFRNVSTPGTLDTASFEQFVISAPIGNDLQLFDMDMDGKCDIVGFSYDSLCVMRNVHTSGSFTSSSFAISRYRAIATDQLQIADVDLDGKPDVIAASKFYTARINVLRNTSTPGLVAFQPYVNHVPSSLTTGYYMMVADVDADGKQDIVYGAGDRKIAFIRNNTSPGSITSSSFATTSITMPEGHLTETPLSVININNDGKPDFAYLSGNTTQIATLQNRTTPGLIDSLSFTLGDFYGGFNFFRGPEIADLNLDGYPDLLSAGSSSDNNLRIHGFGVAHDSDVNLCAGAAIAI